MPAEDFALSFTYSGHPVACAAGLANLDIIDREGLIGRTRKLAPSKRRLGALARHAMVGASPAHWVLELVADQQTKEQTAPSFVCPPPTPARP